jgi:alpha-L-fucosidase 2
MQVGADGRLQEWLREYEEADPGHRHISHLFGVHPGDQITPRETPELADAARESLERRLEHGGGNTGWSRAWSVNQFARFGDGDAARDSLETLVAEYTSSNLFDIHPPDIFQIDGNFGGAAGVVEMLLQSHTDEIELLPALPDAWDEGSVSGLRARGGYEIDLEWAAGRVESATVAAESEGTCRIRFQNAGAYTAVSNGTSVETDNPTHDILTFETEAGREYTITRRE